jgi:surface polysaccharide O-acyltransferase-like enzyme
MPCVIHTAARRWSFTTGAMRLFAFLYMWAPLNLAAPLLGVLVGQTCATVRINHCQQHKVAVLLDSTLVTVIATVALLARGGVLDVSYSILTNGHDVISPLVLIGLIVTSSHSSRFLGAKMFRFLSTYTMEVYVLHEPIILTLRQILCPIGSAPMCQFSRRPCTLIQGSVLHVLTLTCVGFLSWLTNEVNSWGRPRLIRMVRGSRP